MKLSGDFAVWLASPEAAFLSGRYVWAAWDVDEMIAMKEKVAQEEDIPEDDDDLDEWIRVQMWNPEYRPLKKVD